MDSSNMIEGSEEEEEHEEEAQPQTLALKPGR